MLQKAQKNTTRKMQMFLAETAMMMFWKNEIERTFEKGVKMKDKSYLGQEKMQPYYKKAVEKWGENAQYDQTIEEMAELTIAINKLKRMNAGEKMDGAKVKNNLYEEIADVKLCIEELEYMLGKQNIDDAMEKKTKKFLYELEI